jgi:uroporphyrinogen III methyltransferase / synthase
MTIGTARQGKVYLVGAGPGDPSLLTLRGAECLQEADLILHDELVPLSLLEHAPDAAARICLKDLAVTHTERSAEALRKAITAAQTGQTVVRLKGGDPTIFGRCFEETALLRAAGVAYEIVPGVTAACAASAYAEVPLTHREHSSSVVLLTGHESPSKEGEAVDWPHLARLHGTLALYMSMKRLTDVTHRLMQEGMATVTPAAVVQWASTGRQRTLRGIISTIAEQVAAAGLHAPAIVLLGEAVGLQPERSWFEALPLMGQTVLVTRPRAQATAMVRELERLGAEVQLLPVLEIGPPPDEAVVHQAIRDLSRYHWLVFTSGNGVRSFLAQLRQAGQDVRALGHLKIAAIGPQTAATLSSFLLQADIIPREYRSESLAAQLKPLVQGQRVLLARADRGREVLREELGQVAEVTQVAVYSQHDRSEMPEEVRSLLRSARPVWVTLTSANIARQFLALLPEVARMRIGQNLHLASISPVTTEAVKEKGYAVAAEAKEYTAAGVVAAIVQAVCVGREGKVEPTSAAL